MNEEQIKSEYLKDIETITSSKDLLEVRNKYLSKKGKSLEEKDTQKSLLMPL